MLFGSKKAINYKINSVIITQLIQYFPCIKKKAISYLAIQPGFVLLSPESWQSGRLRQS